MMHELSIAQSVIDAVEKRASEWNAARVKSVRLRIGEATGVVTDSLSFCFEMLASLDPRLAGARLQVEIVPHRARCRRCGIDFAVMNFVALCPGCEELSGEIVSGGELQILDMEIDPGADVSRQEGRPCPK
jgi:hydrogenase nickel incorporation protein HypA/HybF